MNILKLFFTVLSVNFIILISGCNQHNDNYAVAKPFAIPKSESKLSQFNNLYPTNKISKEEITLAKQDKEKDLLPPNMG